MVEVGQLKSRLEQSEQQREKTRVRCEELEAVRQKGGREEKRLREEVEKVRGELEECRSELETVAARSKQREGEVEGALSHMQQELAKRAQQVWHRSKPGYLASIPSFKPGYLASILSLKPGYLASILSLKPGYLASILSLKPGYLASRPYS